MMKSKKMKMSTRTPRRNIPHRSVKVGGFFDRHPIFTPALILSLAWVPYVIVFFRNAIAFGGDGMPIPSDQAGYWVLLVLQLVVCVISHSLAVRTIVRLYAPLWLIWGSIIFFALCPMWGVLTGADVRYPLFAMMICVITSAAAFILYSESTNKWLWIELALASALVCLLRETGIWSVAPLLVCLVIFAAAKWRRTRDLKVALPTAKDASAKGHSERMDDQPAKGTVLLANARPADAAAPHTPLRYAFATLAVVFGVVALAACFGLSLPIGEPAYPRDPSLAPDFLVGGAAVSAHPDGTLAAGALSGDTLVGGVLAYTTIEQQSVFLPLAQAASHAIVTFQTLPVVNILFATIPYAILYAAFIVFALVRRDFRALVVGLPQMAILVVMLLDPTKASLSFILPVLAAQIMFFGAILKGCSTMGKRSQAPRG